MDILDVSRRLRPGMAVWPGDTPFDFHLVWEMAAGASCNVGTLTTSVHGGTHVDAPFHFDPGGYRMDEVSLEPYLGLAQVVNVPSCGRITAAAIGEVRAARLLLRSLAWPVDGKFPDSIPVLDPEVPGSLAAAGVRLLGVDVPSVDELDSRELPIHHALQARGICILESLDLSQAEPGLWNLIALPLRIAGADGSPVRAVLTRCAPS